MNHSFTAKYVETGKKTSNPEYIKMSVQIHTAIFLLKSLPSVLLKSYVSHKGIRSMAKQLYSNSSCNLQRDNILFPRDNTTLKFNPEIDRNDVLREA